MLQRISALVQGFTFFMCIYKSARRLQDSSVQRNMGRTDFTHIHYCLVDTLPHMRENLERLE